MKITCFLNHMFMNTFMLYRAQTFWILDDPFFPPHQVNNDYCGLNGFKCVFLITSAEQRKNIFILYIYILWCSFISWKAQELAITVICIEFIYSSVLCYYHTCSSHNELCPVRRDEFKLQIQVTQMSCWKIII